MLIGLVISLIGNLALVAVTSYLMMRLGRRYGNSEGAGSFARRLFRGTLWSIPLCWVFFAAVGHGVSAGLLPAWLLAMRLGLAWTQSLFGGAPQVIASQLAIQDPNVISTHDQIFDFSVWVTVNNLVLMFALTFPISVFVVSARNAFLRTDHSATQIVDDRRGKKRDLYLLSVFSAAHLALTVAVFEGLARLENARMDTRDVRGMSPHPTAFMDFLSDARDWIGLPVLSTLRQWMQLDLTFGAVDSPEFWFIAAFNSVIVAWIVLAIFDLVREMAK